MLPLHTTFKNLVSVAFVLITLISCSERSKADLEVIKTLEESLVNSNKAIAASSSDIMITFEKKLYAAGSAERAMVWYPKAQMIQKVSRDAIDNLEGIKVKIVKDGKKAFGKDFMDLQKILISYKEKILQIDPKITNDFKKSLKVFTDAVDSANNNQDTSLIIYLSQISRPAIKAMLTKLQNNIRINEQRMITYCYDNCGSTCGPWNVDHAVVILNSSVVQSGDQIEITAGMLSFSVNYSPKIFVHGKLVTLSEDAFAHYKLKAASKPGKYYVPVKINYTDQNGKKQSFHKEMEYTVANIQKQ